MKAKFGRYVFLKKLAVGGMAEIFLVRRLSFGGFAKFVVIKRLLPQHRGRRAYERLFLNEAQIAALLNHPNIVSLHDLGMLDDTYFMAMEYVHGLSGAELMSRAAAARKPIPLGVALRIGIDVADALHYVAVTCDLDGTPFGVLHHDVSPHNIQISYEGDVKLLDFGVATRMGFKAPGGRRGKFAYMSPEALTKGDLDPRSDMFSLGVVLYEIATGQRLFKGPTPAETEAKSMAGVVPRPTSLDPYFPESLEAVLMQMLARDRDDRFEDGQAVSTALKQVARNLGVDTSADAMSRYLHDLCGDERAERRAHLYAMAAKADALPTKAKMAADTPTPQTQAAQSPVSDADLSSDDDDVDVPDQSLDLPPASTPAEMPDLDDEEETPLPEGLDSEPTTGGPDPSLGAPLTTLPPVEALAPHVTVSRTNPPVDTLPPEAHDKDEDWDRGGTPPPRGPVRHPASEAPTAPSGHRWRWIAFALILGTGGVFAGHSLRGLRGLHDLRGLRDSASLKITSEPAGARVFDGETLLGITPFSTKPLADGTTLSLRVVLPEHAPWSGSVVVDEDAPTRLQVVLQPKQ